MSHSLYAWLAIVGLTAVTVITRSAFLVLGERFPLPERVQHALRYAPACALSALIAPEVLTAGGALVLDPASPKLAAGLVAVAVMVVSRSMIVTMAIGMGIFTLLRLL
jgi:branched-subunit amino acid transport protein